MRQMASRIRDDAGSVSTAFLIIFPPVLLGMLMAMLSAALYFYGANAAITIAQTGADAAAAEQGSTQACRRAADDIAARVEQAIHNVTVSCSRAATSVTVKVTGTPVSLLTSWAPTVSHSTTVEVERITGP